MLSFLRLRAVQRATGETTRALRHALAESKGRIGMTSKLLADAAVALR